jgi:hypothetical protein
MNEKPFILYHGNCPDGFGGAFAAWKKFGDEAEYRELHRDVPLPENLAGRDLIFIDFCYEKPVMDEILAQARSVVMLDHHEGVEDVVRSLPTYVYDDRRSGATIAWNYFHPDTPVPYFLKLVEQGDLYLPMMDDDRAVMTYAYAQPFSFTVWDELATRIENPAERALIIERGRGYAEYFILLVEQLAKGAIRVAFEGYEPYFVEAPKMFTTAVGMRLAERYPPFSLIAHARADSIRVSMRSVKDFDVSAIARKYGGNGHPNAAAFSIPWGTPLPWKPLEPLKS